MSILDAFSLAAGSEAISLVYPKRGTWVIYALVKRDVVQYVGKTKNLLGRISYHSYDQRSFDRVVFVPIDEVQAKALERRLIAELDPPLNAQFCGRIKRRRRVRRAPRYVGQAWVVQNGRYWKMVWRENGRERSRGLGARKGVPRNMAIEKARLIRAGQFGHDSGRIRSSIARPTDAVAAPHS